MEYVVLALAVLLVSAGVAVWTWYIVARLRGRDPLPRPRRWPVTWGGRQVAGVLLVQIGLAVVFGVLAMGLGDDPSSAVSAEALAVTLAVHVGTVVAAVVLLALWRRSQRRTIGLTCRHGKRQVMRGLLAYLASVPVVYGVFWTLTTILQRMGIRPDPHPLEQAITRGDAGPMVVGLAIVAALVTAPLCDELVFRGVLQGWLGSRLPSGWAIVLVAVMFGAVHPFPTRLPLALLGLVLGYVYHRTHSLVGPIVIHVCFNAASVAFFLVSRVVDAPRPAWIGGFMPW